MVDGLGALPKYDSGVFKGLGIASAYCFPMSVKYEQNSFAIFTLSEQRKLQSKERKIKQLQSPIHQRGMSCTAIRVYDKSDNRGKGIAIRR